MAKQNNLRAIFDWLQIRFNGLCIEEIMSEILMINSDFFLIKTGALEYYDYNRVYDYGGIRIYYVEDDERLDYMLVISGEGLEFYREQILNKMSMCLKDVLSLLFMRYESFFKIVRVDPAIDDFNESPYFTPNQLRKICEKKQFVYGKSTVFEVHGTETKEKGMTLYLKPKSADNRLKFYDKQAEKAEKQKLRKKDLPPQIRTEIVFRRVRAHEFVKHYVQKEIELIDLMKGYLKEKIRFYSDEQWSQPLRKWQQFLGKSEPFKIVVEKSKSELSGKFEWYFKQGSAPVLLAYQFCKENNLLLDEEKEHMKNEILYPPELAKELIKRASLKGRGELIEKIKQQTKKPPNK